MYVLMQLSKDKKSLKQQVENFDHAEDQQKALWKQKRCEFLVKIFSILVLQVMISFIINLPVGYFQLTNASFRL